VPEPTAATKPTPPRADWSADGGALTLRGDWTTGQTAPLWRGLPAELERRKPDLLVIEAADIGRCDSSGIALLLELRRQAEAGWEGAVRIHGLSTENQRLLELFAGASQEAMPVPPARHRSAIEQLGAATSNVYQDTKRQITFIGELAETFFFFFLKPRTLRVGETVVVFEKSGVDALPLVCVISFLMGLIMAFQSALPMRDFGADIFVANLVVIAMFRELGVLMTAVVLAGRSGSAFAAEIGTMKVNEELDALTTMGLNPMRFLVLPRVIAGTLVMPLLTVFANLAGCVGGFVVMLSLGHTPIAIWQQVLMIDPSADLLAGFIKSFVFGFTVAAVGCLRGLETAKGPTAVGDSTTSAVVSGILLVVILDGLFSILFHFIRL
jgi:phospholipid/cholesterol/gamma-HCH transport system permease protein